jgi:hypothetical protein
VALILTFGPISGGHFNPAVTWQMPRKGVFLGRRFRVTSRHRSPEPSSASPQPTLCSASRCSLPRATWLGTLSWPRFFPWPRNFDRVARAQEHRQVLPLAEMPQRLANGCYAVRPWALFRWPPHGPDRTTIGPKQLSCPSTTVTHFHSPEDSHPIFLSFNFFLGCRFFSWSLPRTLRGGVCWPRGASIDVVVALVDLARAVLPLRSLKIAVAILLFAFGLYHLLRPAQPRLSRRVCGKLIRWVLTVLTSARLRKTNSPSFCDQGQSIARA